MNSFIISIDSTFEMTDNFLDRLIKDPVVSESEVVIVLDGNYNSKNHALLTKIEKDHPNVTVIYSEKIGYGKANNLAVRHSHGDILFFINSDIFAAEDCFVKMQKSIENGVADCVQPLLLYPQSNLVQCAGTFFGPYFKDHLFDGNKRDSGIVQQSGPRQALTSALYALPRALFDELGGFDEFYYNKLEGFELSYKIHLRGMTCWYLADAVAWHSRGGGRKQYSFDFKQQEAYFWSRYGGSVKPDIAEYIEQQTTDEMAGERYYAIMMSQIRSWKEILRDTKLTYREMKEMPWIGPEAFNLWDTFPSHLLKSPAPLLLIVENIRYLRGNKYWFELRDNRSDIAVDRFANLVNIQEYLR